MKNTHYDSPGRIYSELAVWMQNQQQHNGDAKERLLRNLRRARASELTPRQAELLALYYDEGKSMRQIAREQDVAVSTVSRTIARAENRLRRCLQYGF